MDQNQLYAIIGKVIKGEASADEKRLLEAWQEKNEENKTLLRKLKGIWIDTEIQSKINTEKPFQKVIAKINKIETFTDQRLNYGPRKNYRWVYYWAAIIAFIIIATWAFYQQQTESTAQSTTIATILKQNPSGQKSKVHLPDGSIVWLNAESSLQYPATFDSLQRVVQLEGEAFFEVVRDSERPFSVITGNVKTTALGTSFNISAYERENEIQVTLATGKVKVESGTDQVKYLEPGFGLLYNKSQMTLSVQERNVEAITAWIDGILLFDEDNFNTIISKLQRWYGVQIEVIGKPDNAITYTAKFKNEYLSNVLESMSFGRPFSYEIEDKVVTIKF